MVSFLGDPTACSDGPKCKVENIRDFVCDDENNNADCDYDGGVCNSKLQMLFPH